MFADDLQGRWKINGDNEQINITIKKYEQDNSLYKIIFYKNGNASVYVENNKIETWTDGTNKKYRIMANSNSFNRDFGKTIEINYAVTKSRTDILAVNANNKNYILTRVQSGQSTSSNSQKSLNKANNQERLLESNSNFNTSSSDNQLPKETQISNINASFASQGKFDIYKFTSYGTFSYKHFYYVQKWGKNGSYTVEREKTENGSYTIMQNNVTKKKSVYLKFENGRTKKGTLFYEANSVEFYIDGKAHKEM